MTRLPDMPLAVADAFAAFPETERASLEEVRRLIFETAAGVPQAGAVEEALRWGQPAYLTPSGAGSTIRLGLTREGVPALFVHCRTRLIEEFRTIAPPRTLFEGTRAVLLDDKSRPDAESLALLIRAALTYRLGATRVAG